MASLLTYLACVHDVDANTLRVLVSNCLNRQTQKVFMARYTPNWERWRDEGRQEGRVEGLVEGQNKGYRDLIQKMQEQGASLDQISLLTGMQLAQLKRFLQ